MKNLILFAHICSTGMFSSGPLVWETDMEMAKTRATLEDKCIILLFHGSDWSKKSVKFVQRIFCTTEFKAYAKEHYIMLMADFPNKKQNALPERQQEENELLAYKFNQRGFFPLVVILDGDGELLGETDCHNGTPKEYIKRLECLRKTRS